MRKVDVERILRGGGDSSSSLAQGFTEKVYRSQEAKRQRRIAINNEDLRSKDDKKQNDNSLASMHLSVYASKIAFTLAEVLITLGIIGVVAALTLPTLIQNYQEKQRVTQLKKGYSVLSQAYQQVINEYGTMDTWNIGDTFVGYDEDNKSIIDKSGQILLKSRLEKYLKTDSNVTIDKLKLYTLNSLPTKSEPVDISDISIHTVDGFTYEIGWLYPSGSSAIWIHLPAGKQQMGVTSFSFTMKKYKIVPDAAFPFDKGYCDISNSMGAPLAHIGRGCAEWVLMHENMDYLRCDYSELLEKGSCK